jgi:hypothetical protein
MLQSHQSSSSERLQPPVAAAAEKKQPDLEIYRYVIEILEARDLDRIDIFQKAHPACVVKIGEEVRKAVANEQAQWFAKFIIYVEKPEDVEFQVVHEDLLKNLVALGRAKVPAANLFRVLRDKEVYEACLPLSNSKDGVLDVKLQCRVVRPDKWERLIKKADDMIKGYEHDLQKLTAEVEVLRMARLKSDVSNELAPSGKTTIDENSIASNSPIRSPKIRSGFQAYLYIIDVVGAENLSGADMTCQVQVGKTTFQTAKCEDSKHIEWEEVFRFLTEKDDPVEFSIFSRGLMGPYVLATGHLNTSDLFHKDSPNQSGTTAMDIPLKLTSPGPANAPKPVLKIRLTYAHLD